MEAILKELVAEERLWKVKALVHDYINKWRGNDVKRFYKNEYHIQHSKTYMNCLLYGFIAAKNPKNVFEFGCNCGRHLKRLNDYIKCKCKGIDISPGAIEAGKEIYGLDIEVAEENYMTKVKTNQYDIAFTNSVLNHIPEVGKIIKNLQRISKAVVLVESNSKEEKYWFKHDYLKYGFEIVLVEFAPEVNCLYKLYYYEKFL